MEMHDIETAPIYTRTRTGQKH